MSISSEPGYVNPLKELTMAHEMLCQPVLGEQWELSVREPRKMVNHAHAVLINRLASYAQQLETHVNPLQVAQQIRGLIAGGQS
jgi:hypothetical protein